MGVKNDENAKLMAHLRFISGQANMLMELCLTFITTNSNITELAQHFEATAKSTLAHTDAKLAAQEYVDGELEIVNRVRRYVKSALPRNKKQRKDSAVLLGAAEIKTGGDKTATGKSSASRTFAARTIERIYYDAGS